MLLLLEHVEHAIRLFEYRKNNYFCHTLVCRRSADRTFRCMRGRLSALTTTSGQCTASPDDQLLYFWIHWSYNAPLGFHLTSESVQVFQVGPRIRPLFHVSVSVSGCVSGRFQCGYPIPRFSIRQTYDLPVFSLLLPVLT